MNDCIFFLVVGAEIPLEFLLPFIELSSPLAGLKVLDVKVIVGKDPLANDPALLIFNVLRKKGRFIIDNLFNFDESLRVDRFICEVLYFFLEGLPDSHVLLEIIVS